MTNTEIIQAIRNEVERLIKESDFDESANLYSLLSFLSTLETENPMNGLEEEIKRYYDDWDGDCRYVQTARHFAKWGAEHLKK